MGNPILRPDPGPLLRYKGFFVANRTSNEVGSFPDDVFVRQQRHASACFCPLVSIDGGLLKQEWAGQRLQWVYGALREGGVFFRVHSCGRLEFVGTAQHPSPDWLDFMGPGTVASPERHISPGYVEYVTVQHEADEESGDEEGYHDAPAVYVGGEAELSPADRPSCLRCRGGMSYVGRVESDVFSDDLEEERAIHLLYCGDCRLQCCIDTPCSDVAIDYVTMR